VKKITNISNNRASSRLRHGN